MKLEQELIWPDLVPQQECLDGGAVNWPAAPGSACLSIVLEIMNKRETVVSLLVKPARRQAGMAASVRPSVSDLRSINKYQRRRRRRRRDNGTEQ